MKHKIVNRILSLVIAIATLIGVVPMTTITVWAAEINENKSANTTVAGEKPLTPAETIQKEMSERKPITADRSEGAAGPYAVYVDGKFRANGQFSDMWNLALQLAPNAKKDSSQSGESKEPKVEFVLYFDMKYDSEWFGEGTMTVSNKKLTIDLNGHVLRRGDKGSVIKVTDAAVLTIMDSNPTRVNGGYLGSNNTWVSSIFDKSHTIKGGVITGGNCGTGDGAGIYIEENSTVYLMGGTIAGNKADVGSAVYLEDNSTLDMSKGVSQICYNYCAGTSSDGGTIFLRSDCTVIGGYVHNNLADDYGGGVRAKGDNILIKDVVIYNNEAKDYGGGLYIERSLTGQTVTVSGCKIIGNFTGVAGGGAYLYDLEMVNMNDCWIENNSANKEGGGICVSDWTGTDLSISGKMIVRNNYASQKIKSNLYLEGDEDLIVESLSLGSEIWIRTEAAADSYNGINCPIVTKETAASHLFFFADEDGYCVKYQSDVNKDHYRYLYLEKGTRTEQGLQTLEDYSVHQMTKPYKVETGEYKGMTMPLYSGWFQFDLSTTSEFLGTSSFYYSDGYFLEDPKVYNTHLATMSISAAIAAFGKTTSHVGNNAYANHFANIKQLFADIGCADVNFFANEDYQIKPEYYGEKDRLSTIGVAISQKEIKVGDETYTLVPIAIRGGGYESEWSSNVTIGNSGEAKGFADAANQVYKHVQNYIANYGLTEQTMNGKVKFWVVGYSRAGATANLTAKRLIDYYTYVGNQVYGYTFEAPMGGAESAKIKTDYTGNGAYPTIHNTINELDFVTLVAPSEMGFMRYGVDHLVGTDYKNGKDVNSSAYNADLNGMLRQLRSINPYYNFDQRWKVAELSILYGGIFGNGVLDDDIQFWDDPNKECENMYDFLRWFFVRFQADGLNLPGMDQSREYYSAFKPLGSIDGNNKTELHYSDKNYNFGYSDMSVEDAAAAFVSLMMGGALDEKLDPLLDILKAEMIQLGYDTLDELIKINGNNLLLFLVMLIPNLIMTGYTVAEVYHLLIVDWDTHTEKRKSELINQIMHLIFDHRTQGQSVWDVLSDEEEKIIAEGLPVILWFALNLISKDYNTSEGDDGMWCIPTFVTNAGAITANHYQEVSLAWVRSYDSNYQNVVALRANTIDTDKINNKAPTGTYASATQTVTLSAEAGSSIFYSVDDGQSWHLYTKATALEKSPEKILCFSIYRGVKSDVVEISLNGWSGSLLGNGNMWFLLVGSAFIVGFCVISIEMSRKKKKEINNI